MKTILVGLMLMLAVHGGIRGVKDEGTSIVFDNRPEMGVPPEALEQMFPKQPAKDAPLPDQNRMPTLYDLTDGRIKTVRIRYYDRGTWATDALAREYVRGYFANKSSHAFGFQIWSQGVTGPQIECLIDFTEEYRRKLRDESKPFREGRLLIWNTESCFRDATGKWWFVDLFDYYHKAHPRGKTK